MKLKNKYLYVGLLAAAFLLLISRRPENLTHPQFWAEDGRVWFADSYNIGAIRTFVITQDGYFQTLSRITAGISLLVPLANAPLVFNVIALSIQLLPVLLLLSGRLNSLIPDRKIRFLFMFLYLALPNTAEIYGNLTNAQWFLALAASMVLLAETDKKKAWKFFDITIVTLSGLSGPFSIFLFPVALLRFLITKNRWTGVLSIVLALTGLVQAAGIFLLTHGARINVLPEITPRLFMAILNRQVFMGSVIGENGYMWSLTHISFYYWLFAVTTVAGLVQVTYAAFKSTWELRLFILFGFLVFCASLISPTVADKSMPAWKVLSRSIAGARYWLIPMSGFITVVIWNLRKKNPLIIRGLAGVFLTGSLIGIIMDWEHPKYVDYHFKDYVNSFEALPAGQKITIPINPPGWDMELIKH